MLDLLGAPDDGIEDHTCPSCRDEAVKLPSIATQTLHGPSSEPCAPTTPQLPLCGTPQDTAQPQLEEGVDVCDEDAPMHAAEETAALFPGEAWLAERAAVRLAAVGLLPALRAGRRGAVPDTVWNRTVSRFRLPEAFVRRAVEAHATDPAAKCGGNMPRDASDGTLHQRRVVAWMAWCPRSRCIPPGSI